MDNSPEISDSYEKALQYMYAQLPMFHRVGPAAYKPGLDNTIALLHAHGNPHQNLKCVHIAGTNGKGSTAHLVASVLQQAGYRTGLYTSPHLFDFRERIRINGEMIPKEEVARFVGQNKGLWDKLKPSFFEITVAMAFDYFSREKVDIAVIETGLGGRLDSTNVIMPEVSVITSIGMDHMNLLGNSLTEIASEKAGIIKPGIPVVLGFLPAEAQHVCTDMALRCGSAVFQADESTPLLPVGLHGNYQRWNARTAYLVIRVLQEQGYAITETDLLEGFVRVVENTGIAGRWQVINNKPLVVVDVAHNEDGISEVLAQVREQSYSRLHIVLGMVQDKDVDHVLTLFPEDAVYYFCKADIPRGMDARELQQKASVTGLKGQVFSSVESAVKNAIANCESDHMALITGSFFTAGEALASLQS
jgi:dihydrofolate synthase/folylpolyglutamate synthase